MTRRSNLGRIAEHYETHDASTELEGAESEDTTAAVPMVTTSLRLPKPIMDALRAAADSRGVRTTALMREWLEERLARDLDLEDISIPASALLAFVAERSAGRPRAS